MAIIGLCTGGATLQGTIESFRASPAGRLIQFLEQSGHRVVEFSDPVATHFVSLDHHKDALKAVSANINVENRILVVQEPRVVQPANYVKRIQNKYGFVLSLTPETGNEFLPWPQANWPEMKIHSSRRKLNSVILVNANKSSFLPGSEYGLRRRVVKEFLKNQIQVDLAGSGWDRSGYAQLKHNLVGIAYAAINGYWPRLKEYSFTTKNHRYLVKHGIVEDKYELMAQNDFALVIENSQTYISEKLFDAVISGCIPLFCGPDLSKFGIPGDIALELPNTPKAFVQAFREMSIDDKNRIRDNGKRWLRERSTIATWSQDPALERIAGAISKRIVSQSH